MYQLATGRLPFPGSNFGEVLIGHLQQAPPKPRSLKPEIPESYEAVILKSLEKRQEDRYQTMKELKQAIVTCMDQLGLSKELPQADETDPEMAAVESPRSSPGQRTPGRVTNPPAKSRISNPNARPGMRTSNPSARASQAGRPSTRPGPSRPGTGTMPPQPSHTGLYVGIAVAALLVVGAVAFILVRSANQRTAMVADALSKVPRSPVTPKQPPSDEDTSPVFLSVISEPQEAEVSATWKDGGQQKGKAPLSFEVPKNTKVHFEFSKAGYIGYSMDVIADQAQNVHAQLRPAPVAAADPAEKKSTKKTRKEKPDKAPSKDGLIDLDDALK
jgi:hypothetical protein